MPPSNDAEKKLDPKSADTLWASQSTLLWSKLQTISAVEVGTLVGAYYLWKGNETGFLILLLLIANWFLFLTWLLMLRDWTYLDHFREAASFKRPSGILTGKIIGNLIVWSSIIPNTLIGGLVLFRIFCSCSH